MIDGYQVNVCIDVDDLLVTSKNVGVIQNVISNLRGTYKEITVDEGIFGTDF